MSTLSTYEVELQSPVDQQHRVVSGEFESREAAIAHAEQRELDRVNFSLLPPEKDVWEQGTYLVQEGGHAQVNLSNWDAYHPGFAKHAAGLSYKAAVDVATKRLESLSRSVDIAPNGKVRHSNLSARALTRLYAHNQLEPYTVSSVREIDVVERDALRLVQQVKAAHTADPRKWALALRKLREADIPMAAVTAALSGPSMRAQISGSSPWIWSSATIQCSLHTAFSFDPDATDFQDDINASEITGTGYTALGATLGTKTDNYTSGTDLVWLDAADASWTTSTLSATDACVWVNTAGAASTDDVLGNIDFGATVTTTAGTFLITFDATGGIVAIDVT